MGMPLEVTVHRGKAAHPPQSICRTCLIPDLNNRNPTPHPTPPTPPGTYVERVISQM